jgi:putative ABC transport system permease protein
MLFNYLKITFRNILKHKSYSAINVFGLMIGMTACILIGMYIKEELSFDDFHENKDRIAVIAIDHAYFGTMATTPYPLADAISSQIPEAEAATRFGYSSNMLLSKDDRSNFIEISQVKYAEPSFFDVFSYELISGNQKTALSAPNQVVLSSESSKKIFGDTNPVGKSIAWAQRDTVVFLEVSGVIEDTPANTAVPFNALISFNTLSERRRPVNGWGNYSFSTFALFKNAEALENSHESLASIAEANNKGHIPVFFTIPITEFHLSESSRNSGFTGDVKYLYFFSTIALFILLIACVNYVNLSTARIGTRARETGIRKTLGARREQITFQFLSESVLLSLAAFLLSVSLTGFILPFFNSLFGTELVWAENRLFLLYMAIAAIFIGILAGTYPALYLSRFSPSKVLKSKLPSGSSGSLIRNSLVVSQFAIALILIAGSLVIYKQLQFTQNKDLGFSGEQVVVIDLPNSQAWQARQSLRDNVRSHAGVLDATLANGAPGDFNVRLSLRPGELTSDAKTDSDEGISIAPGVVDEGFVDVLNIELLAGRNFSQEYTSDFDRGYLINQKTAELLGWTPKEAIGKNFKLSNEGVVVGVVENFHLTSLHEEIEPIVLQMHEGRMWRNQGLLLARLQPDRITETMEFLKSEIATFSQYQQFTYEFLDDKFDAMYRTEKRLGNIVTIFTFIAIFVACLGLYGLAAFAAERRVKEIGIRKVMGASVGGIVTLLSKDFIKLIVIGFIFATPVSWYLLNQWLADFEYRIEIGPGIFALAGAMTLIIALLTVSWQSIKAALANPVDSLKSE